MLFNQIAEGAFSAIAASFNPALKRDGAKARRPFHYVRACLRHLAFLSLMVYFIYHDYF